jgi:O-antigen ligase
VLFRSVYSLFLSLQDRPSAWRFAAAGFCAVLGFQVLAGLWEFSSQSTAFLAPLMLNWPGAIVPSMSGASIVELVNGTRWLRAYGTLPHPNILGTLIVALMAGPVAFFLASRKLKIWPVLLFVAGMALLIVTFSRGAWIGLLAGTILVLFKLRNLLRTRLLVLGLAGAASLAAAIFPVQQLVYTRIADTSIVPAEQFSIRGRTWLAEQAVSMIATHPFLGSGAGTFALDLARRAPLGYLVEPVHNLPLLVASDLGLPGLLILLGLTTAFFGTVRKVRRPEAIILSAAVLGLGVTSLFDHALWTLAPGRVLIGFMLGLWAGQVRQDAA